ncbi:UNVERIFIED_CONTAM: SUN domain-containing protein 1 [Sesamum radiatum]|uniref:SUN domain-containing protein 1 n=1 Tax=Sesamum radiatum TaxID=300843 RepID=A0AAW2VJ16_SESRA
MSASTVSVTANQGPTTRRRAVEKNPPTGGPDVAAAANVTVAENKDARLTAGDTAAAILRDARKTPGQTQSKKSGLARKPAKPRWLTAVSILTKNLALLVVILGFVQMIRWVVLNAGPDARDISVISGDFDGRFAEVEKFVKTTVKAMQVQVNAIDRKLDDEISLVRREFDEKVEKKGDEMDLKLKALDARSDAFEKFMDEFRTKSLLSKEDFGEFFEEFKKAMENPAGGGGGAEVSLDEIRDYAREIVEKEIERHAADGLGMVDYALSSGGGRVLRHSEPYGGGVWFLNRVSPEAGKMIRPSFGEPGQCFPLKGRSGFIEIRLRSAIVPEAVTLEHVAKFVGDCLVYGIGKSLKATYCVYVKQVLGKDMALGGGHVKELSERLSVAYDRSSAPKHCRVSGWLQEQDSTDSEVGSKKMLLLTEFTYDLEKSHAQTFKVGSAASNLVDTIRLDFTSNHGSATHTCIYRLRVHGREPSSVPMLEKQS